MANKKDFEASLKDLPADLQQIVRQRLLGFPPKDDTKAQRMFRGMLKNGKDD